MIRRVNCITEVTAPGFALAIGHGSFWFRLLGYGLSIVDRTVHPPLFSERTGHVKALRLSKYSIRWLSRANA